jgi:hypothetical protein
LASHDATSGNPMAMHCYWIAVVGYLLLYPFCIGCAIFHYQHRQVPSFSLV